MQKLKVSGEPGLKIEWKLMYGQMDEAIALLPSLMLSVNSAIVIICCIHCTCAVQVTLFNTTLCIVFVCTLSCLPALSWHFMLQSRCYIKDVILKSFFYIGITVSGLIKNIVVTECVINMFLTVVIVTMYVANCKLWAVCQQFYLQNEAAVECKTL